MRTGLFTSRLPAIVLVCSLVCSATLDAAPELKKQTIEAWDNYIALTEKRFDDLANPTVPPRSDWELIKAGKTYIQRLETRDSKGKEIDIPNGAVHHWLGSIFIPDMTVEKLIPKIQDYDVYKDYFNGVEKSSTLRPPNGNEYDIFLRMTRSAFGVTANFNTKHHVTYRPRSGGFLASISRSREVRQVKNAGSPKETEYPVGDDSGYLWRLNSYWRYIERDKGVVVECESIGLSRALGAVGGFFNFISFNMINGKAEAIARDALTDTLTDLRNYASGGARKAAR